MGLDCSHDAWHGSYSAFARWREKIAELAGVPLGLMDGFLGYSFGDADVEAFLKNYRGTDAGAFYHLVRAAVRTVPIAWSSLKPSALHELLNHSDCDGQIAAEKCGPLADALEQLLPEMPDGGEPGHVGSYRATTRTFIDGLRRAAAANEPLGFH
jgi:hypothetical protein